MAKPQLYLNSSGNIDNSELISSLRSTIEQFFPDNKMSLGALKRKLPFFLLHAAHQASLPAYGTMLFNATKWQYETVLGFITDIPNTWVHTSPIYSRMSAAKARAHFDNMFRTDKFVPYPTIWARVKLNTNVGSFIYERTKSEADTYGVYWHFTMTPTASSWNERISRFFCRKSEEEIKVITVSIQDTAPAHPPVLPPVHSTSVP